MDKQLLLSGLLIALVFAGGCEQSTHSRQTAPVGDDMILCEPAANTPAPLFKNGDVVRYKTSENDTVGIVTECDYKYVPSLKTYYCIVEFYPATTTKKKFSRFNNCERKYILECKLEKEDKEIANKIRQNQIPNRWDWMYRN